MTRMKEKIKNLFSFLGCAWSGGIRGKCGIALSILACVMFISLFCGSVSVQRFGINIWHLNNAIEQLEHEQHELERVQQHILLLQHHSPDYVDELGLKYLNIGDPKFKILKF